MILKYKEFNESWLTRSQFVKINKNVKNYDFNHVKEIIMKDCKPFIDLLNRSNEMNKKSDSLFFRGVIHLEYKMDLDPYGIHKRKTRIDRDPKDTNKFIHDDVNDIFEKKFNIRLRSDSVFATKHLGSTEGYGSSYIFFPIGDFKFFYSKYYADLYSEISNEPWYIYAISNDIRAALEHEYQEDPLYRKDFDTDREYQDYLEKMKKRMKLEYKEFLDNVEKTYQQGETFSDIVTEEVMFVCDSYYLVELEYLKDMIDWFNIS